jgi:nuclear transcription factor Y gamma
MSKRAREDVDSLQPMPPVANLAPDQLQHLAAQQQQQQQQAHMAAQQMLPPPPAADDKPSKKKSKANSGAAVAAPAAAPTKKAPAGASAASAKGRDAARAEYLHTMSTFWEDQLAWSTSAEGMAKPVLPLARIKKIIKQDDDVRSSVMISGEAPFLISRACELFTLDLTMRAWAHTDSTNRRTLQRSDVADAVASTEQFDFLLDVVPRDETHQQAALQPVSTASILSSLHAKPAPSPAAAAAPHAQPIQQHHPQAIQQHHPQQQQQQHQQMMHAQSPHMYVSPATPYGYSITPSTPLTPLQIQQQQYMFQLQQQQQQQQYSVSTPVYQ